MRSMQCGNLECWEPSQHLLIDTGKPRKTCVEVACKAHAPYFHMWPQSLQYFSTSSHKRHGFRGRIRREKKKAIEHKMCALIFSTRFACNISHSKKNSARYCHKCTYIGLDVMYRYYCPNLMLMLVSILMLKLILVLILCQCTGKVNVCINVNITVSTV